MIVLGIDPSLCNTGIAAMDLSPSGERVVEALVIRTEPSGKRMRIRKGDDTARRIAEIASGLDAAIGRHRPVALVVEAPAGSKGAKAAAALAGAMAAVVTVATLRRLPLVHVTPMDVKHAMVPGQKVVSKDEIVLAVERRHPEVVWPKPAGIVEHAADAIGAVVAALDSETLRLARRLTEGPSLPRGGAIGSGDEAADPGTPSGPQKRSRRACRYGAQVCTHRQCQESVP